MQKLENVIKESNINFQDFYNCSCYVRKPSIEDDNDCIDSKIDS